MVVQVFLLRHEAAEPHGDDLERPLTEAGQASARRAAENLARQGCDFDLCLVSPAKRARMTAEIYWKAVGRGRLCEERGLAPGADADDLAVLVNAQLEPNRTRRVLVVGHNPDLLYCLHSWANEKLSAAVSLAPGSLARIDFGDQVRTKEGRFVACLRAEQVAVTGDSPLLQ